MSTGSLKNSKGIRGFLLKNFFNPLELYALYAYNIVVGK
jgi:hypothetical protein